jgi:hypothetical protein
VVVLLPPTLDQDFGVQQGVEDLPFQQFIAQLAVEAFDVAILVSWVCPSL